jgi:fructosamine-3-kinase
MERIADEDQGRHVEALGGRHGAHAATEGTAADGDATGLDRELLRQPQRGLAHGLNTHRRWIGASLAGCLSRELDPLDSDAGTTHRHVDGNESGLLTPGARARREHESCNSRVGHRAIMACVGASESLARVHWRLADALGPVDSARALGGTAYLVEVGGRRLVAKFGPGCGDEAEGLRRLGAAPGGPPVPAIVLGEPDLLVTVAVDQAPRRAVHDEALGRGLALVHQAAFPHWGGGSPWVGACPVDPAPRTDGPDFYGARLLDLSARCALEHVVGPVVARLEELLPPGGPVLVHGDLWWGNVLSGSDGRSWLIDPSVHGGHAEEDLAMLALFGPVPDRLLGAYAEARPLHAGWEQRVALFQLVPLLVHAVLFGGGYRGQAEGLARRFA